MTAATILAAGPAPAGDGGDNLFGPLGGMVPALLLVMVAFYFILLRPQKKEQATRQAMLNELKKNDRILTAGGIYGVVTNVRKDDDEVTIKVDESTNTKLRILRSSIQRVIVDKPAGEKETK